MVGHLAMPTKICFANSPLLRYWYTHRNIFEHFLPYCSFTRYWRARVFAREQRLYRIKPLRYCLRHNMRAIPNQRRLLEHPIQRCTQRTLREDNRQQNDHDRV